MRHMEKTALILEGGGMRATYSAGILSVLIEKGLHFPYIAGISAGTTLLTNYVLRDVPRLRASFIDAATDPEFAGLRHFLRGEGYFHSQYIYGAMCYDDGILPFDWCKWQESSEEVVIGAYNAQLGEMQYWHKKDIESLGDLMRVCRASASLPILMPPTYIEGVSYVDGGVRDGFGLEQAIRDGYERFVIVPTHVRGYRRETMKPNLLYKRILHKTPLVYEAMLERAKHYNASMALIEELEAAGKATVLYPETMPLSRSTTDKDSLIQGYEAGRAQALRDFDTWFPVEA